MSEPAAAVATPPAPAPAAVSPETIPASTAAILSHDTASYREARRFEKLGKPLAAVPAPVEKAEKTPTETPPAADSATPAARQVSRRQQALNDAAQKAADSATAALREENARLKAQLESRPAPPAPAPAPETPTPAAPAPPDWKADAKRYAAMPDYPKIADFDTLEEHAAAVQLFMGEQRATEQRQRGALDATRAARGQQLKGFVDQLTAAKAADPTFLDSLDPVVKTQLKPFDALKRHADGTYAEPAGPINVIGELVYLSPQAPKMLQYFSTHMDDLTRLCTLPAHLATLPDTPVRTNAHITWMTQEYGKLEAKVEGATAAPAPPPAVPKTLTSAPAPPKTLGSRPTEAADPKAAAIRNHDTSAYRAIRLAEKRAQMGR
jgi:hypothetical protein